MKALDDPDRSIRIEVVKAVAALTGRHIHTGRLSAGILFMSPFIRHDFFDFYDIFISFDDIKYRKGSADMKTVRRRRMGVSEFFLVAFRKRIFFQVKDFGCVQ